MLSSTTRLSILHEVGVNDVAITFLPEALTRLLSFFKQGTNEIDPRWFTGDWSIDTGINDIGKYIQSKPISLGKASALSPALTNITARLCGCNLHIPPLSTSDLRCGTLILSLTESKIIVSSSLPRLFLAEDVQCAKGKPENQESSQFPNDSNDFSYASVSDMKQCFRAQITLTRVSTTFQPSLPYYDAKQSQQLLNIASVVMLGSYETSDEDIRGVRDHLFLSAVVQDADINVDFDVISSAITTLMSHQEALSMEPIDPSMPTLSDLVASVNILARVSLTELNFRIWRQHLCLDTSNGTMSTIPIALLLRFNVENIDLGALVLCNDVSRSEVPFCIKGSVGKMQLLTSELDSLSTAEGSQNEDLEPKDPEEVAILSFGLPLLNQSENHRSILFRLEKWQEAGTFNASLVMSSGEIIVSDRLNDMLSSIIEGLLHPEWTRFPDIFSEGDNQVDDSIDWRLRLLSTVLCTNANIIESVHLGCRLENVSLIIPHTESKKKFALVGEALNLHTGYLRNSQMPLAQRKQWENVYRDSAPGFHHVVSSRQRCLIYETDDVKIRDESAREVISSFSFDSYFHPINLHGSLNNYSLSLEEWNDWNELSRTLLAYQEKFMLLYDETSISLTMLKSKVNAERAISQQTASSSGEEKSPLLLACEASSSEIKFTRNLLQEVKEALLSSEHKFQSFSRDADAEMVKLRESVFLNEMERTSAFSLVSHQMSGFVRMSGTAISGQRFVSSTSFWKYYAVVRGSNMIIFQNTADVSFRFSFSKHAEPISFSLAFFSI